MWGQELEIQEEPRGPFSAIYIMRADLSYRDMSSRCVKIAENDPSGKGGGVLFVTLVCVLLLF